MLEREGLVAGHAYSLLQVREVSENFELMGGKDSKFRLLQIRNPWGTFEWKGSWSDKSSKWQKYPHIKKQVKLTLLFPFSSLLHFSLPFLAFFFSFTCRTLTTEPFGWRLRTFQRFTLASTFAIEPPPRMRRSMSTKTMVHAVSSRDGFVVVPTFGCCARVQETFTVLMTRRVKRWMPRNTSVVAVFRISRCESAVCVSEDSMCTFISSGLIMGSVAYTSLRMKRSCGAIL